MADPLINVSNAFIKSWAAYYGLGETLTCGAFSSRSLGVYWIFMGRSIY